MTVYKWLCLGQNSPFSSNLLLKGLFIHKLEIALSLALSGPCCLGVISSTRRDEKPSAYWANVKASLNAYWTGICAISSNISTTLVGSGLPGARVGALAGVLRRLVGLTPPRPGWARVSVYVRMGVRRYGTPIAHLGRARASRMLCPVPVLGEVSPFTWVKGVGTAWPVCLPEWYQICTPPSLTLTA